LRSNGQIDVAGKTISGSFYVYTEQDDDYFGFAFGYQGRGQMYVFDWKMANQDPVLQGMSVKLIDTGSPNVDPERTDFSTSSNTSNTTILKQNSIPWKYKTDYDFLLNFGDGQFDIEISEDGMLLEQWTVTDDTYTNGDFGFYNLSQPFVRYSNLVVTPIPGAVILLGSGLFGLVVFRRKLRA
jgi:hypothetical protein